MNQRLRLWGACLLVWLLSIPVTQAQNIVTVGTGTVNLSNTSYPAPYGNWYWGARHQFIIRASELNAAGATPGFLSSLAFDVATVQGTPLTDFAIRIGTTTDSVLSSTTGFNNTLTQVFSTPSYTEVAGWNTHAFTTNFFWNGTSNLIIETCFNNSAYTNNAVVNQTDVAYNASMFYIADAAGVCTNTTPFISTSTNRPNMRFNILSITGRDVSAAAILSPVAPAAGGSSTQVSIQVRSMAADPITSASVGYRIGNGTPVIESWTGSLNLGQNSTHTFAAPITLPTTGTLSITAWANNANGLGADINVNNDTVRTSLCIALGAGAYTVGSPTANFPTIQAAVDAINCGGVGGAVTFSILPGTYYGSYTLNNISGASIANQITFTSSTGLAADVVLIHDTTSAATNRNIFTINGTQGVTFNALTLRRTINPASGNFANILVPNADNLTVTSCVFDDQTNLTSTPFGSNGIRVDNGSFGNYTGNTFNGFYYSLWLNGPTANSNYEQLNTVVANTFNNYRYAVYTQNQALINVSDNNISTAATTFGYGVYVSRAVGITINANKITGLIANGGIFVSNTNDSTVGPNLITNNVVSGSFISTSTFSSVYGIYVGASFSATATNPVNGLDDVEVAFNTINLTIDAPTSSAFGLLHFTGGSTTTPAFSNILSLNNHVTGYAAGAGLGTNTVAAFFGHDSIVAVLTSNHNNYYLADANGSISANNLVRNNTTPTLFATVASWTTASGKDANSVSLNPAFTSQALPIPANNAVNNLGTPYALVSSDAAGIARNATTPDIGAYEFTPAPFDLAVVSVLVPGRCSGPNQSVSVRLRSVGTSTWNFVANTAVINLNITGPGGPQTFSITINTDTLASGAERTYLVTTAANFTQGGNYTLAAELQSANDGNALNNTNSRIQNVVAPIAQPYTEAFNGTAAPSNVTGNMTFNATTGVGQSGGMRYNVYATQVANIRTPIIGPLDTNAVFDFDYKITNWSGWSWPGVASVLGTDDTIRIEVSTNCGQSFLLHDSITAGTHISSNAFATKRVNLGAFANQQVIVRLVFRQASGIDVFFDVDNFRIFTPSPVDMGVLAIVSPNDGCGLSGNDTVRVRVVNYGTVSQNNIPVAYTVNGGTPVTAVIPNTMLPGDSLTYTFATTANLGVTGNYQLRAYTGANNDGDVTNDTTGRLVRNFPVISTYPYLENFEGTANGWFSGGNSSSWALGTPSAAIITGAASGTKAWATNLTGNYNTGENSWVQSPCFDLSSPNLVSPELRFKLWYEVGQFDGGANVQYSTNGGQTWTTLGNTTSGLQNWYNGATITNSGTPAQPGWFGNTGNTTFPGSGGYIEVAHSLNALRGQSSVIFRVRFYSATFATLRNGIAFDDFRVFQPLDPVITSVDTLINGCAVGPRAVTAAVFNFSPVTATTLHYRLSPSGTFTAAPMLFVSATGRWSGNIPTGTPNSRISYFVTTVDSAGLRDTSGVLNYIDEYLQPNAGTDTTIVAGASVTRIAGGAAFAGQVGTGTVTNTTTTYPAPYGGFYWGARHQFLVLASELSAAGINAGPLASLAFKVITAQGDPLSDFTIKLGNTSTTNITSWESGLTTVYNVASYTDTLGWNPHIFQTPFVWDGSSNLVVEVCFNNTLYTDNAVVEQSTTTFTSSLWYRADAAGVCGNTLTTSSIAQRPNMLFAGGYPFSWTNLNTGTVISTTNPVLTVSPTATTSYQLRLNDGVCNKADTVTVTVNQPQPDFGVTIIMEPHGSVQVNQPHTVMAVIRNFSSVPGTGFDVAYSLNGVEINANAISRTVPANDTIHHIFSQAWTPTTGGTHVMCSYTKSSTDPNLLNDTTCRTYLNVSVEERSDLLNKVYPNPADQFVNFEFAGKEGVGTLEIRDQLGRMVYRTEVDLSTGGRHEVKTETFSSGVYNYRFVQSDKVQHGQLMIRR